MSEGESTNSLQPLPVSLNQESPTLEQLLKEKAPDVFEKIPQDKKRELASIRIEEHKISMRSGPLPEPAELEAFNRIIPNGAERIFKMVEEQSAHRIRIETTVITSQQTQGRNGQIFAALLGVIGIGCGTAAALYGHDGFGCTLVGGTLVSLVTSFLYSRHAQKAELEAKHPQVMPDLPELPNGLNPDKKKKKKNRR
jgi:uncharacterized membrane protein